MSLSESVEIGQRIYADHQPVYRSSATREALELEPQALDRISPPSLGPFHHHILESNNDLRSHGIA
jgi:hypothetical protein